jgi:hypothetical protein
LVETPESKEEVKATVMALNTSEIETSSIEKVID